MLLLVLFFKLPVTRNGVSLVALSVLTCAHIVLTGRVFSPHVVSRFAADVSRAG